MSADGEIPIGYKLTIDGLQESQARIGAFSQAMAQASMQGKADLSGLDSAVGQTAIGMGRLEQAGSRVAMSNTQLIGSVIGLGASVAGLVISTTYLERQHIRVESATIQVQRAQETLNKTLESGTATSAQIKIAQENLEKTQNNLAYQTQRAQDNYVMFAITLTQTVFGAVQSVTSIITGLKQAHELATIVTGLHSGAETIHAGVMASGIAPTLGLAGATTALNTAMLPEIVIILAVVAAIVAVLVVTGKYKDVMADVTNVINSVGKSLGITGTAFSDAGNASQSFGDGLPETQLDQFSKKVEQLNRDLQEYNDLTNPSTTMGATKGGLVNIGTTAVTATSTLASYQAEKALQTQIKDELKLAELYNNKERAIELVVASSLHLVDINKTQMDALTGQSAELRNQVLLVQQQIDKENQLAAVRDSSNKKKADMMKGGWLSPHDLAEQMTEQLKSILNGDLPVGWSGLVNTLTGTVTTINTLKDVSTRLATETFFLKLASDAMQKGDFASAQDYFNRAMHEQSLAHSKGPSVTGFENLNTLAGQNWGQSDAYTHGVNPLAAGYSVYNGYGSVGNHPTQSMSGGLMTMSSHSDELHNFYVTMVANEQMFGTYGAGYGLHTLDYNRSAVDSGAALQQIQYQRSSEDWNIFFALQSAGLFKPDKSLSLEENLQIAHKIYFGLYDNPETIAGDAGHYSLRGDVKSSLQSEHVKHWATYEFQDARMMDRRVDHWNISIPTKEEMRMAIADSAFDTEEHFQQGLKDLKDELTSSPETIINTLNTPDGIRDLTNMLRFDNLAQPIGLGTGA